MEIGSFGKMQTVPDGGVAELAGRVVQGLGAAKGAITAQLPAMAHVVPELAGVLPGTINVLLDDALLVRSPDIRLPPIKWHPDADPEPVELVRCQVAFKPGEWVPGWVYRPMHSPHRADPRHIELMFCGRVEVAVGQPVAIRFNRQCRPLRWMEY
jgi:hypothetical protein